MATILITGFGPFPGTPDNPSARLVARLARLRRPALSRHTLITHVFATSYGAVDGELPALLAQHRPSALIMFGLANRTNFMRIERQAGNRLSRLLPDRQHNVPGSNAIRRGSPPALRGRAPFVRLLAAARTSGLVCRLSSDAGRYVCNYAYWRALEAAEAPNGPQIVVFVHVPKLHDRIRPPGKLRRPSLDMLAGAAQAVLISAAAAAH